MVAVVVGERNKTMRSTTRQSKTVLRKACPSETKQGHVITRPMNYFEELDSSVLTDELEHSLERGARHDFGALSARKTGTKKRNRS